MKFNVTVSKYFVGNIEVCAESRDEAAEKAASEENRDKIKWNDKECFNVGKVCHIPLTCPVCNVELPDDSCFCNKCGVKI